MVYAVVHYYKSLVVPNAHWYAGMHGGQESQDLTSLTAHLFGHAAASLSRANDYSTRSKHPPTLRGKTKNTMELNAI